MYCLNNQLIYFSNLIFYTLTLTGAKDMSYFFKKHIDILELKLVKYVEVCLKLQLYKSWSKKQMITWMQVKTLSISKSLLWFSSYSPKDLFTNKIGLIPQKYTQNRETQSTKNSHKFWKSWHFLGKLFVAEFCKKLFYFSPKL